MRGTGRGGFVESLENQPTEIDIKAHAGKRSHDRPQRFQKLLFLGLTEIEFAHILQIVGRIEAWRGQDASHTHGCAVFHGLREAGFIELAHADLLSFRSFPSPKSI
ncbi:hypothetical protein DY251_02515 [Mesorhizobium denitrificans]|uniref:Uncharacterized protein n=1 Tax=Mesorhizobium denitrificans TaxID=2294114 RepID=A0A371XK62_9HYPH|nr:hypothetical protein DY251_02515 [Mesorhizobium denitrificans]